MHWICAKFLTISSTTLNKLCFCELPLELCFFFFHIVNSFTILFVNWAFRWFVLIPFHVRAMYVDLITSSSFILIVSFVLKTNSQDEGYVFFFSDHNVSQLELNNASLIPNLSSIQLFHIMCRNFSKGDLLVDYITTSFNNEIKLFLIKFTQ